MPEAPMLHIPDDVPAAEAYARCSHLAIGAHPDDVSAEAHPWYRIIKADLFVLALLACATFGLAWSYTQFSGLISMAYLFFTLFVAANLILFGGVYWSKFAHMFYKPGAAIQKNLAEADGSRDNLPPPADAPEQFGLGIKREEPKHY